MKKFLRQKFISDSVTWKDYIAALIFAGVASAIVYGLEQMTVEKFSNISGFLIISVLMSAMLLGKGPAIVTATGCSFLYDWLMVPPFFGTTNSIDNVIKFSVFIIAALLTSWIAGMARSYAIELKRRERELMRTIEEKERYKNEKEEEIIRREAETLRNAILASVSHDLKTPLASIIGAVSSYKLCEDDLSEEDRDKLISSVLSEANKLHGYLNNILEVAKLEEKHHMIKRETLAVDDVLDLTLKRMSAVLKGHHIKVRQEGGTLAFTGDERLMDIALGNLLDNAVKFSKEGSVITITASPLEKRGQLAINIQDEGTGVPSEEMEKVFDKFYRASKADHKNTGTGLGLWIARRIIEAHDGTIRLCEQENQKGTCVSIKLPLAHIKSSHIAMFKEAV